MQDAQEYKSFRISTGGLIYDLLTRIRIQSPECYSTRRRILTFVLLCWFPLLLLALIEGNLFNANLELPFIYDLKPYVRYLFALPVLIVADVLIDPLIASNLQSIASSGVLGENSREQYAKAVQRLARRKNSYLADVVILLITLLIMLSFLANLEALDISSRFTDWMTIDGDGATKLTYAGWWFLLISSPLLQIVLFRWLWRYYLWAEFLFHVSKIKLKLQPTHPDLSGGLGILKNGEGAFILIFIAFGAMLSVSVAEDILYFGLTLTEVVPIVSVFVVASLVITILPLFFFTRQLILAKRWGRVVYGGLGYKLSRGFDEKWGDPSNQSSGSELLKTADSSAVCDYADIYGVVREMRYLPISLKDIVIQGVVLLVPFMPLVFTEIPVTEVFSRLLGALV